MTSLLISLLIASSPYFIFTSLFVGNNIMVLPVLLLFLIVHLYMLGEKTVPKKPLLLFAVGLLLGYITEFEFAFGLFLIPTYFLIILIHKNLRSHFLSINNVKFAVIGLILPFIPRLLFELKNNFLQTNSFLTTLLHKNMQNPNLYAGAFKDRLNLIFDYYRSLFSSDLTLLFFTLFVVFIFFLAIEYKKLKFNNAFSFFIFLFAGLFLLSIAYKNNFFWGNYFEGIQYLYLLLIAFVLSAQSKIYSTLLLVLKILLFSYVLISTIATTIPNNKNGALIPGILISQQQIVDYILAAEKNNSSFCVKIYTPPVIPYTYNYLFLYGKLAKQTVIPEKDWVRQQCWTIIEPDDYKERQANWIKDNIPRVANKLSEKNINGTLIQLYEKE